MSYSFTVVSASKDDVKAQAAAKFDEIVASQTVHAKDKDAALAACNAFVDLIDDVPEDKEVVLYAYGSLSWNFDSPAITGAQIGVQVNLREKPAA